MSGTEPHGPLDQFNIVPISGSVDIGGYAFYFSNSSLFMCLAVASISLFMWLSMRSRALVPGRWQNFAEICYEFVADTVRENVGDEGRRYFPFIFSLFMFILFCNLLGLLPGSFTVTSHLAVTFALAAFIFVSVTIIGFVTHGAGYFGFFLPKGTPWWMAPIMVVIELFAYLIRPLTLSVRLAANMLAGHIVLKVIAGFVISMGLMLGWVPFVFLIALSGFELFVAGLQAYIFTILTCVYLSDAIHLH